MASDNFLAIDTGVLPYGCPLCGKRFARSDVRGRHITGIHEKDPAEVLKGTETRRGKSGELPGDVPEMPQQSYVTVRRA
jgi:hypothetical protein